MPQTTEISTHLQAALAALSTVSDPVEGSTTVSIPMHEMALAIVSLGEARRLTAEIPAAANGPELAHFQCGKCGLDVYMRPENVLHSPARYDESGCDYYIQKSGTRSHGTMLQCPGHERGMTYYLRYVDGATVAKECPDCGDLDDHTHEPCARISCKGTIWVGNDEDPRDLNNVSPKTGLLFCDDCWYDADHRATPGDPGVE